EDAVAGADGGGSLPERIPGEADAGCEVQVVVVGDLGAPGRVLIVDDDAVEDVAGAGHQVSGGIDLRGLGEAPKSRGEAGEHVVLVDGRAEGGVSDTEA